MKLYLLNDPPYKKWMGYTGYPGFIWTEHLEREQSIKFKLTNGKDTSEAFAISRIDDVDLALGTQALQFPV